MSESVHAASASSAYASAQSSVYASSSSGGSFASLPGTLTSNGYYSAHTNDYAHIPVPPLPRRQSSEDDISDSGLSMFTATSVLPPIVGAAQPSRKRTHASKAPSHSSSTTSGSSSFRSTRIAALEDKENSHQQQRRRVRMPGKASLPGFPFRSSVVALGTANPNISPRPRPNSESSSGSSGDVNLDLSYEADMPMTADITRADWIGIDMTSSEHGVPSSELVRSPSGRVLIGTHRRNKSTAEGGLRALYLAEERARQLEHSSTMIPSSSSRTVKAVDTGFSFNATDPVEPNDDVRLPMGEEWRGDDSLPPKRSPFALPVRFFEGKGSSTAGTDNAASPVSSPAWSITSFFSGSTFSRNKQRSEGTATDGEPSPRSDQAPWVDAVTQTTMQYVRGRQETLARSPLSQSMLSNEFSVTQQTPVSTSRRRTSNGSPSTAVSVSVTDGDQSGQGTIRQRRRTLRGLGISGVDHTTVPTVSISPAEVVTRPSLDESLASSAESETRASPSKRLSGDNRASRDRVEELLNRSHSASTHTATSNESKFGFKPAPLKLVESHWNELHRPERAPRQAIEHSSSADIQIAAESRQLEHRPIRGNRIKTALLSPSTALETVVPAKALFLAGFLLPWLWLIGGWYVRRSDGELSTTVGTRCRSNSCNCGIMFSNKCVGLASRHKRSASTEQELYDEWVWRCRVASVFSSAAVVAVVGVALWTIVV